MIEPLVLLFSILPRERSGLHGLAVRDVEAMTELDLPQRSFLVTLQLGYDNGEAIYSQGTLHSLDDDRKYPIRSNRSLYDALNDFVAQRRSEEMH